MPYRRIDDAATLRRLLDAVLMIEADVDLPTLLRHIVQEATQLVGARYGALGILNSSRTGLDQFLTVGLTEDQERAIGARPTGRGVLGLLITDPDPLRLRRLADHADSYGVPANHPPMSSFLGVPVRSRGEVFGNLYLTDKVQGDEFSGEDEALAEGLALAAGIAIENFRLHERVRDLSVRDDRDRIARDLHDLVIQRVFAVGLQLQQATGLTDVTQVLEKVERAVDDLDLTITDIRSAIYELGGATVRGGLRQSIDELAAELAPMLGSRPSVDVIGSVDGLLSQRVSDNLLAVLREALTNVGRHAQAAHVKIALVVDDHVTLCVSDDGVGFSPHEVEHRRLGLINLENRAHRLGGVLIVEPADVGGTVLTWRVPNQ